MYQKYSKQEIVDSVNELTLTEQKLTLNLLDDLQGLLKESDSDLDSGAKIMQKELTLNELKEFKTKTMNDIILESDPEKKQMLEMLFLTTCESVEELEEELK